MDKERRPGNEGWECAEINFQRYTVVPWCCLRSCITMAKLAYASIYQWTNPSLVYTYILCIAPFGTELRCSLLASVQMLSTCPRHLVPIHEASSVAQVFSTPCIQLSRSGVASGFRRFIVLNILWCSLWVFWTGAYMYIHLRYETANLTIERLRAALDYLNLRWNSIYNYNLSLYCHWTAAITARGQGHHTGQEHPRAQNTAMSLKFGLSLSVDWKWGQVRCIEVG